MFILKKKRVFLFLFTLIITVSVIMINNNNNNKSIETMTWFLSKKVIVLDAGHGLPDERSIQ